MAIFFEDTAPSKMLQQGTPVGISPGQFKVSEHIGVRFFAAADNGLGQQLDSTLTLYGVKQDLTVFKRTTPLHPELTPLSMSRILDDNDFSIKMQIRRFQRLSLGLSDGKPKGLTAFSRLKQATTDRLGRLQRLRFSH